MKIRSGFVSNSSSASFVVFWSVNIKPKDLESFQSLPDDIKIRVLIMNVFNSEEFLNLGIQNLYSDIDKIIDIEEIISSTTKLDETVFSTRFFTSMMNDFGDFGITCMSFLAGLQMDQALNHQQRFKVLNQTIDCD